MKLLNEILLFATISLIAIGATFILNQNQLFIFLTLFCGGISLISIFIYLIYVSHSKNCTFIFDKNKDVILVRTKNEEITLPLKTIKEVILHSGRRDLEKTAFSFPFNAAYYFEVRTYNYIVEINCLQINDYGMKMLNKLKTKHEVKFLAIPSFSSPSSNTSNDGKN